MSDQRAAQEIRRRIEEAGGPLQMPARQLRDAFGRQALGEAERREIAAALTDEGLTAEPSVLSVDPDSLVTVRIVARRAAPVPPPPPPQSTARRAWSEYRRLPAWLQLLVPVVLVLVIAGAASGGGSSGGGGGEQHAQPALTATTDTQAEERLRREERRARRTQRRALQRERDARQREREVRQREREQRRRERQQEEAQAAPVPDDSGGSGGSGCDPNYSGACVPTDQGDVDCSDIPETDFNSIGSDPDRLDADGDGIACES